MSDTPDEKQRELLSVFVDGELAADEQNRLIDRLASDAALRAQMSRYRQISAQLQEQGERTVDATGVAEAVSATLEQQPTVLAPQSPRRRINLPRVAWGAALAATVAAVAVTVAPQVLEQGVEPLPPQTFAFSPRLSVPSVDVTTVALGGFSNNQEDEASPQVWKVLNPELRNKLNDYMIEHNEYAGRLGVAQPSVHVGFISNNNAQH